MALNFKIFPFMFHLFHEFNISFLTTYDPEKRIYFCQKGIIDKSTVYGIFKPGICIYDNRY